MDSGGNGVSVRNLGRSEMSRFSCGAGGLIVSRCQNEKREKGGQEKEREEEEEGEEEGEEEEKNIQLMRQITTIL